jgi:hypothetical protein
MLNFNACLVRHAHQPLPIFTVFNICHSFMLVWDVGTIDLVVVAKANPTGSESSCLGERPKKKHDTLQAARTYHKISQQ